MIKENIVIDLDDKIIDFICKETNESQEIVKKYMEVL